MNLKKKCSIVMLPTQKAENCILSSVIQGKIFYEKGYFTQEYLNGIDKKSYHLYVISDDKIEEGDICYYKNALGGGNFLVIYTKYNTYHELNVNPIEEYGTIEGGITPLKSEIFKIIASTDKALNLPQPSPQFIQKYCDEYNKRNQITDVMVTYDYNLPDTDNDYNKVQVDKNNCITITKIKDSWSKEELGQLFEKFAIYCFNEAKEAVLWTNDYPIKIKDKWIKDNL